MRRHIPLPPLSSLAGLLAKNKWGLSANGCRPWRGTIRPDGYGCFVVANVQYLAHRAAWALANGRDPGCLKVLHSCDNPPCGNPSHLFRGTNADNQRDKVAKGRQRKGTSIPWARLTPEKVQAIRRLRQDFSQIDVAWLFGVAPGSIQDIDDGAAWKHVL